MSATVTIFNHSMRPVPYNSDGQTVGAMQTVEADPSDPVCALAIEQGHVTVLTPSEPIEVANSSDDVVFADDVTVSVAEAEATVADATSEAPEGEADDAKPASRKKNTTQASKES